NHGACPGIRTARRPSCRTCRAVLWAALGPFDSQPAARGRQATEPPRNRATCRRRSSRLPATSSATEGSARCLTFLHLNQAYNNSAACHLSGSVTHRHGKIVGSHARLTRNSELIDPLVLPGFSF